MKKEFNAIRTFDGNYLALEELDQFGMRIETPRPKKKVRPVTREELIKIQQERVQLQERSN